MGLMRLPIAIGNKAIQWLTYRLVCRTTEHLLGRLIKEGNPLVPVYRNDGVHGVRP